MDPNACLVRLLSAMGTGKNRDDSEVMAAGADLLLWLLGGGALPDISLAERATLELGFARAADAAETAAGLLPVTIGSPLNFNGARVIRRAPGVDSIGPTKGVIFIPLPRELWRDDGWGCCCKFCSDTPRVSGGPSYWDTLAISPRKPDRACADTVWTVHAPELHGAKPKRANH